MISVDYVRQMAAYNQWMNDKLYEAAARLTDEQRNTYKVTGDKVDARAAYKVDAITYDGNTGAGSSWEPRVADPRGRSFILQAEMKF